ncbi:hypothetical protein CYLTODRAFT_345337 [Cylindrobasidium torrendii FP15055 ss-10]|uniref:Uncharacterized protein n=1 Tax=Cylindrobasidium torrendii FP15055 ss-10 TaxID=1314674 RepID=A0A0D7BMG5_9AGAR|nr:hypothetical protein CYLTODRAFT_345337 [Cylindrobasidium torrendii FP15055 ss-10]
MAACSTSNDRLDPATLKFKSDCDDKTFCSAPTNGTCFPRTCRRDEYPFGYSAEDTIPALCSPGLFCPDEGSGCRPLISPGGTCQRHRDEQCAPAPDGSSQVACILSVCSYTNATLSQPCIVENTTYSDFFAGHRYQTVYLGDNCARPNFFCSPTTHLCESTMDVGKSCTFDSQCRTRTCEHGICTLPPETPLTLQTWQMAITICCMIGVLVATIVMLVLLHRKQRMRQFKELRGYQDEQLHLRDSVLALHSAAATTHPSKQL